MLSTSKLFGLAAGTLSALGKKRPSRSPPGPSLGAHAPAPVSRPRRILPLGAAPLPVDVSPFELWVADAQEAQDPALMGQKIEALRARNETVIVLDRGAQLLARHFRADTDFILNPFDQRCVNWSPLLELSAQNDPKTLARYLMDDGTPLERPGRADAQALLARLIQRLASTGTPRLQDLLHCALVASAPELRRLLRETQEPARWEDPQRFAAWREAASECLDVYRYLPLQTEGFSVTEMVHAEHSGFLFVTYLDDQLSSLRGLMGCLLACAAQAVVSPPAQPARRVWLVVNDHAPASQEQASRPERSEAGQPASSLPPGSARPLVKGITVGVAPVPALRHTHVLVARRPTSY